MVLVVEFVSLDSQYVESSELEPFAYGTAISYTM